jgi:hypothetical protein
MANKIYWNANLLDFTFIGDIESPLNWKGLVIPGANDVAILGAEAGQPYSVTSNPGLLALLDLGTPAVETLYGLQTASNVTLGLTGNVSLLGLLQQDTVLYLSHGTAGGVNAGTIDIKNAVLDTGLPIVGTILDSLLGASATLEVSGTFNNKGTVILDQQPHLLSILGAPYQSTYLVIAGGAIFTGGGHITLTDENLNFITGTTSKSYLENVDNVISGAGDLGSGKMRFFNEAAGVVDANGVNALVFNTGRALSTNKGLMEATGAGGLIILGSKIDNTGGTISAGSGSAVILTSSNITGGTLASSGSGVIETSNYNNTISDLTNGAEIVVQRDTSLNILGAIDNTGVIDLAGTKKYASYLLVGKSGATLSGGGIVELSYGRFYSLTSGAVLTNVDDTITGTGSLGLGRLKIVNEANGVIDSDTGGYLYVKADGLIANAGTLEATDGKLVIQGGVNNTGKIVASNGRVFVEGAVTGKGDAEIFSGGTITFESSFTENVSFGSPTTSGRLTLADSVGYTGTVYNFSTTRKNQLDLEDIAYSKKTTATFAGTATGGVLTVTDGSHTANIKLSGDYLGSKFSVSSDGHGGTIIVDPPATKTTSSVPGFVSAMASLGASSGSGHATQDAVSHQTVMLVAPNSALG